MIAASCPRVSDHVLSWPPCFAENAIPGLGPIAARTDDTRVLSCVPATLAPTRNVLSIIAAISAWSRHVVVSAQLGHWSLAPPGEPPSVPTSISQQILRYPFPHRSRPTLDPEGREHFPLRSTIPTKPLGVACRRRTLIGVSNARSQPPGVCRMCPFFVLLLTAPTTQTACPAAAASFLESRANLQLQEPDCIVSCKSTEPTP